MRRRDFITIIGSAALGWPLVAHAQQQAMPVIGFLRSSRADDSQGLVAALRQGLRESGYTDSKNFAFAFRYAENHLERLRGLAADLVSRRVAVIVSNNTAMPAAMSATKSIPIVFVTAGDPVQRGLVRSLAHPGGNITGVSFFSAALQPKQLELLFELVPKAKIVALLMDPKHPRAKADLRQLETAVRTLGRKAIMFEAAREEDLSPVFSAISKASADALFVGPSAFFISRRRQLVQLAAHHQIPASYFAIRFVKAGGLMSYAGDQFDAYRRAGVYVSRILKGEKPGDLPVQLPIKYKLAFNLKTAKMLGLAIPPKLLARADEVIE